MALQQPCHTARADQRRTYCRKATAPKASGPMAKRPVIAPGSNINTTGASTAAPMKERKSVVKGKSVSVRVDLGGRRSIEKKKNDSLNVDLGCTRIIKYNTTYMVHKIYKNILHEYHLNKYIHNHNR